MGKQTSDFLFRGISDLLPRQLTIYLRVPGPLSFFRIGSNGEGLVAPADPQPSHETYDLPDFGLHFTDALSIPDPVTRSLTCMSETASLKSFIERASVLQGIREVRGLVLLGISAQEKSHHGADSTSFVLLGA